MLKHLVIQQGQGNQCQTPGVKFKNKLEETGKSGKKLEETGRNRKKRRNWKKKKEGKWEETGRN